MENDQRVVEWLRRSSSTVAFTGAGISTESGIPDFRSPGGVWANNRTVYFDEFLASAEARHEYWRQKAIAHADFSQAEPNAGHRVLARWEAAGRLEAVITQNIDGMHQAADSRRVLELHGTAREVACLDCGVRLDAAPLVERFLRQDRVPPCPECAGRLKHATVSFGQALPEGVLTDAVALAEGAEVFLAIGSSLVVEPAASLPQIAKSTRSRLIIINRDQTPLDDLADAVFREPIGEALSRLDAGLTASTP